MDSVNHPAHYAGSGLECIDVIEAALGPYGFRMFCLGNVLKYSWRHRQKNGAEDLAKADVYRAWMMSGTSQHRNPVALAAQIRPTESVAGGMGAFLADLPPAVQELMDRQDEDAPTEHLKAGEALNPVSQADEE